MSARVRIGWPGGSGRRSIARPDRDDVAGDELAGGDLRQLAVAPHSGLEDRHLLQGGDGRGGLALLLQALPPR